MSQNSIIRQWNGRTIRQRKDGYFSATDMCQACNKRFHNWERTDSAKEYLKALQDKRYSDVSNGRLVDIVQGGIPEEQGTWVYRKVAMRLAQWLSPEFAVQVDEWAEELMTNGSVSIVEHQEKPLALPVQTAIAEAEIIAGWLEQNLGIDKTISNLMKVDMVAKQIPHHKDTFEQAKRLLGATDPLEAVGMTPTQIGEHFSPTKKAKEVNDLLESLGLQYKMFRTSTKSGKQKFNWQLTEEGAKHAIVHKVTNNNFNGNQIMWQKSAIQLIQDFLNSAEAN